MNHENRVCLIFEDSYEKHIEDKIHLHNLLTQLTFLIANVKMGKDLEHLKETAALFSKTAEEMYTVWNIPKHYVISGNHEYLNALKEQELLPITECICDGSCENECEDCDSDELYENLSELLSLLNGVTDGMETLLAQMEAEA